MSFESTIAGVLDTNVLVYAHLTDAEFHSESSILMNLARKGGQDFAVTPQILMEFYSVMTASRRVSTPYTPEEALTAIERLLTMPGIFVLPYPVDIIDRTQELLQIHRVIGPAVFDLQIVATMLGNGVGRIYTFDRKGFEPFAEIKVEIPFSTLKNSAA